MNRGLINCIYVPHRLISELNLLAAISAQEHASTKKQAAQNTSLSLVRQLFHMGVLEAAEPGQVQPKKTKTDEVSASWLSLVLVLVKRESISKVSKHLLRWHWLILIAVTSVESIDIKQNVFVTMVKDMVAYMFNG